MQYCTHQIKRTMQYCTHQIKRTVQYCRHPNKTHNAVLHTSNKTHNAVLHTPNKTHNAVLHTSKQHFSTTQKSGSWSRKGFICFQLMRQVLNSLQDGGLGDFNVLPLDLRLFGVVHRVDWYTVTNVTNNGKDIIFRFKQSKKRGSIIRRSVGSYLPVENIPQTSSSK
jgi:hypothetical protein